MKKTNSLLARLVTLVLMICLVFSLAIVVSTATGETATITFDNTSKRTTFNTSQQIWEENGITFTNDKSASGDDVADYANPVRLYAGSKIVIEAPGNIKTIVFTTGSSSYATTLKNSIGNAATASGSIVTANLDGPSNTFTVAKLTAQVRLKSITVTYAAAAEPEPPAATYNATFYNNGVQYSTEEGVSEATMPSAPVLDGEFSLSYTFAGWAKNEITDETTTKPTLYNAGDKVTLTGDTEFYAVYSWTESGGSKAFTLTDIADIDATDVFVITMTTGAKVYALSSANGSSSAPSAVVITVDNKIITSDVTENLKWNVGKDNGNYTFYPNGTTSKWLYCNSSNNGVRVGTNTNKVFTIDSDSGYLKHTGTSRYVGVYTSSTPDWRCYTSTGTNISGQTLGFYVLKGSDTTYYTTTLESSGSSPEACQHEWNDGAITTDPTCTATGVRTYTCTICGETKVETVSATGHSWDDGVQTQDPTCTVAGVKTYTCTICGETKNETVSVKEHPWDDGVQTQNPTCTVAGVKTYTCTGCGETKTEEISTVPHTFVDKICSECGAEDVDYSGLYYIATIRSSGNYFWMTNNLGTASTNRYQAVDSGLTELPEKINSAELNKMFCVVKNNDGTYSIYSMGITGEDKWLGWTSGNSGTFVNESDKINFTVTEKTDGTYNFCFDDRYLSLNGTTGNNYFAFYTGTQKQDLSLIPVEYDYKYVNLRLGSDLALLYTVYVHSDGTPTMTFTMGDKETVVTEFEKSGKFYTFAFEGIGPHQMGDKINAVLKIGETIITEINNYSINDNLNNVIANYPEAVALAEAALAYGKAAAAYQSEDPADLGLSGVTIDENLVQQPIVSQDPDVASLAKFTAAGVYFDVTNKIYVKFNAVDGCKLIVNGEEIDLTTLECVNGTYKYYTDEITAVEFGEEFTFVIKDVDGNEITTLTYSVNAYAAAMQNSTKNYIANLVKALYLYGQAALEYKTLNGGNK